MCWHINREYRLSNNKIGRETTEAPERIHGVNKGIRKKKGKRELLRNLGFTVQGFAVRGLRVSAGRDGIHDKSATIDAFGFTTVMRM